MFAIEGAEGILEDMMKYLKEEDRRVSVSPDSSVWSFSTQREGAISAVFDVSRWPSKRSATGIKLHTCSEGVAMLFD